MTDRHRGSNRQRLDLSTVIPWENVSGETVPAYGVVQLRTDFDVTSKASKPDGAVGLFFVNGPLEVLNEERGESLTWDRPRKVLTSGTLEVGDEVGPVADQWYMSVTGTGWRVLHQPVDDITVVVQDGRCSRVRVAIVGSLTAPATSDAVPTTGVGALLEYDTDGSLMSTDGRVSFKNYDSTLTASDGTYAKLEFLGGQWEVYWVACSATTAWVGLELVPEEEPP